jgi:KaiC/GvpD/RAD55 family RecA-like ATPase
VAEVCTLGQVAATELNRLRLDNKPTGLPSGFDLERRVPGGIPRDKVTTIFAEAGNFKTTVKNHILISMAEAGHRVLDVTLEDSKELSAHRFLARHNGVSYGAISGGVLNSVDVARLELPPEARATADRIIMVDDIDPTVEAIFEMANAAANSKAGLACLAIDYVQLLAGPGGMKDRLDHLMVTAQSFAKRRKVAVLLVSQQKQANERERDNPRPETGDMLGSSAMRIGSKLILGLFCPYNYCKAPSSTKGAYGMYAKYLSANPAHVETYPEILEAWVLKNVLGQEGALHLRVHRQTGVIENYDDAMRPVTA